MEYLIYNKLHWMDELSVQDLADYRSSEHNNRKYENRYGVGDIVEVRPDGYWTREGAPGFNKTVFSLIVVAGEPVDKTLEERLYYGRRRFSFTIESSGKVLRKTERRETLDDPDANRPVSTKLSDVVTDIDIDSTHSLLTGISTVTLR